MGFIEEIMLYIIFYYILVQCSDRCFITGIQHFPISISFPISKFVTWVILFIQDVDLGGSQGWPASPFWEKNVVDYMNHWSLIRAQSYAVSRPPFKKILIRHCLALHFVSIFSCLTRWKFHSNMVKPTKQHVIVWYK